MHRRTSKDNLGSFVVNMRFIEEVQTAINELVKKSSLVTCAESIILFGNEAIFLPVYKTLDKIFRSGGILNTK